MRCTLAFALLVCLSPAAMGQGLPKGEELLDKYIEVTGGKAAYEKFKNRLTKGTVEIAGLGVKGSVTIAQAAPSLMVMEMNLEGLGKFTSGCDGTTVWELNPITGPRIKTGKERATGLRSALFNSDVDWRKIYAKADTAGEEAVDGNPAYKVLATTTDGDGVTKFFDKTSGLLIKTIMTVETPQGKIETTNLVSDYQKHDGIVQPHRVLTKVLTTEFVITVNSIENNVTFPPDRFALPDPIKSLGK